MQKGELRNYSHPDFKAGLFIIEQDGKYTCSLDNKTILTYDSMPALLVEMAHRGHNHEAIRLKGEWALIWADEVFYSELLLLDDEENKDGG